MGRNEKGVLDATSTKRIQRLADEWVKAPLLGAEKLTACDLRLLLENFAPIQDLIRAIAFSGSADNFSDAQPQDATNPSAEASELIASQGDLSEKPKQSESALSKAEQLNRQLLNDLEQCAAKTEKLLCENNNLDQIRKQLEARLAEVENELTGCKFKLSSSAQPPAELALLRQDTELAQKLGLGNLPASDTEALIQVVAVLAQRDNLERLWHALKERCESLNRKAMQQEIHLLEAALAWYNHNWQSRPYRRIDVVVRASYDFECHQRSHYTPSGDSISELRLPGIADGSSKPVCKALVCTS